MSAIIKADPNGAVTLPADLCRQAGVVPGAELVAEVQNGQIVVAPARPTLGERIAARALALPPEVLDQFPVDGTAQPRRPIWEEIIALTADISPEELDKPPVDGAAQLDHYLYGHPKRPE